MSTTVLLLSTDGAANLRCSLPLAIAQEGARAVVVDNASSDATGAIAHWHGVECLRFERRHSYTQAINAALAATDAEAVLLLNADCFLAPDFLTRARPRLEEAGVGSVAPKVIRARGATPEARMNRIDAAGIHMHRARKNVLAGHGRRLPAFETPAEVFGADGAAALYRREMLEDCAIDGSILDEDFEKLASDVDLAWRAWLLGWRCVYEPRAVAWHIRSYRPSTRRRMSERERRLVFRNRYLMIVKNDTWRDLIRDLPFVALYELLVLGYALAGERHLLRGYLEVGRLLPAACRKRAVVQARRRERGMPNAPFGMRPRAGPGARHGASWQDPRDEAVLHRGVAGRPSTRPR